MIKRGFFCVVSVLSICSLNAQIGGGITQDTNTDTVTNLVGQTYATNSPLGAFWLGFGIAFGFMVFGWALRISLRIGGHNSKVD